MKQYNNKTICPLVSVIIPVFNGSSYLEETVKSVQNSSFKDFEVLLIDDGSTDKSKKICKSLEKKYPNVRFYSFAKNKGLGRVLNFALVKAHGKYICRINQDDRMYRYRINTQVNFLNKNPDVVAVGSKIKLFTNRGETQIIGFLEKDEDIKKMWHIVSPFADPSVLYRKETALKAGGYKQEFWPADDTQLWYRLGLLGKLANIQKPLVEVRFHKNAASVKYFRKLALSTYNMHQWANQFVSEASIFIRAYWIIQLIAGLTLPPDFNWSIYRILKRVINSFQLLRDFVNKKAKTSKVKEVNPQPKKLNLSGV